MNNEQFRMIAVPGICHENRQDRYFASGRTVGEYLHELGWTTDGLNARVFIDGRHVPDAEWLTAEPKPGQAVVVRRIYSGGGGGNQGKQILQIIGTVALAVGAAFAAPYLAAFVGITSKAGVAAVQAGLTVGGMLFMNAHIPASRPRRALPQPRRELKEAA